MKALALVGLALASCAEASVIETINTDVNHTRTYAHYTGVDKRYLQKGEAGNCYAFAYTKQTDLVTKGIQSSILTCRLTTGEGHAFLFTADGVLDNRFDRVVSYGDVGCQ